MSGTPAYSAKQFYLDDYARTLFPLNTNKFLIQNGEERVRQRIDQILSGQGNFLPQVRAYAAKDALHLRRTFKLDPVCEFYLYDLIYRNRNIFRRAHNKNKSHYGYRFEDGLPIPASRSYRDFKSDVFTNSLFMEHFIGFDVASYFNSLYHHDLIEWFSARGASKLDSDGFNKFLREIASGRSLDCLPHGLYPTKMIGNDFLRFIEEAHFLKSSIVCRFMDDVYIFSDKKSDVISDFLSIQRVLGQKSMSVNPGKTGTVKPRTNEANDGIDDLKKKLLARRRRIVTTSLYDDEDEGDDEHAEMFIDVALNLSNAELRYVHGLLSQHNIEEDDAELILTVMRNHAEDVKTYIPDIATRFPHLAKNVHHFCAQITDVGFIADLVHSLATNPATQEYQLFWLGMMLEEYLMSSHRAAAILTALYNHQNATPISRAKILEISDQRYGLNELREGHLMSGHSDWLSWAAAVGSRSIDRAARNYRLTYFKNASPMNELISDIVSSQP